MNRLKPKDIKPLREQLLQKQNNTCAICHEHLVSEEAVLDHCHRTGYIRAVLHRGCNAYIGALENNQARNRISDTRLANILLNFTKYVVSYTEQLHPTHKTPEERKERAKKRAKARRLKNAKKS